MPYRLIISQRTNAQIDEGVHYLAHVLSSPDAARAVLDDIAEVYDLLARIPSAYPRCRDPHLRAKGYRKIVLPHHDYVFIYRIEEDAVYIVGFFHMRENYQKKL